MGVAESALGLYSTVGSVLASGYGAAKTASASKKIAAQQQEQATALQRQTGIERARKDAASARVALAMKRARNPNYAFRNQESANLVGGPQ